LAKGEGDEIDRGLMYDGHDGLTHGRRRIV
jgi:hypothetical protein